MRYVCTYHKGGRAVPDASADPGGLAEREEPCRPPRPVPVVLAVAAVLAAGDGAVPAVPVAGLEVAPEGAAGGRGGDDCDRCDGGGLSGGGGLSNVPMLPASRFPCRTEIGIFRSSWHLALLN